MKEFEDLFGDSGIMHDVATEVNLVPVYITAILKDRGITRTSLAKYLGVTRDTIWTWQKQEYRPDIASYLAIRKLAQAVEKRNGVLS